MIEVQLFVMISLFHKRVGQSHFCSSLHHSFIGVSSLLHLSHQHMHILQKCYMKYDEYVDYLLVLGHIQNACHFQRWYKATTTILFKTIIIRIKMGPLVHPTRLQTTFNMPTLKSHALIDPNRPIHPLYSALFNLFENNNPKKEPKSTKSNYTHTVGPHHNPQYST